MEDNNINNLEINDSQSGRCNKDDKEFFNDQRAKEGLNYGEFLHKLIENYKLNGITDADLNVNNDLKDLTKCFGAIENIVRAVATKSQSFVLTSNQAAQEKVDMAKAKMNEVIDVYGAKEEGYKTRINELLAEKDALDKQVKEIAKELADKDKSILDLDKTNKDLEVDINILKNEKSNLIEELKDKNITITALREIEKENNHNKKEIEELTLEAMNMQGEITNLESKLSNALNEANNNMDSYLEVKANLEHKVEELTSKEEENKKLLSVIDNNKETIRDLTSNLALQEELVKSKESNIIAVTKELESVKLDIKEKDNIIANLNREYRDKDVQHAKELVSIENKAIKRITEEKDKEIAELKSKILELEFNLKKTLEEK